VFKAKKILRKTGIVIQEDLTKIRADTILKKAIDIAGLKNVWTLEGTIMAVQNNKRYRINSFEDLGLLSRVSTEKGKPLDESAESPAADSKETM